MASKTIQELLDECANNGYTPKKRTTGKGFRHVKASREVVATNKVSEKYQRTLSPAKLESYTECDFDLLIPAIISERPEEFEELNNEDGRWVIDGQNKEVLFLADTVDQPDAFMHEMVIKHEYDDSISLDANYKKVLKSEARLFNHLNTMRKKLSRIDELRSEVCQEEKQALQIEEIMKTLNFVADRFGSGEKDATELTSFGQFYYCLTGDHEPSDPRSINDFLAGQRLWNKIYGSKSTINPQDKVHGTAFRAICLLDKFIKTALSNGKQKNFKEWVEKELAKNYTPIKLVKGYGTFTSPRQTLHRIIEKYNDHLENTGQANKGTTIGPVTLYHAAMSVNKQFKNPDEDAWSKVEKFVEGK